MQNRRRRRVDAAWPMTIDRRTIDSCAHSPSVKPCSRTPRWKDRS